MKNVNDWNWKDWVVAIGFLVILSMTVVGFVVADEYNLTHNETYMFYHNYSLFNCSDNSTTTNFFNESFNCPACLNSTLNVTIIEYEEIIVCNETYSFSIDLLSGQTISSSYDRCYYNISCGENSSSVGASCVIDDKSIEPGERFRYDTGACDLDITCDECEVLTGEVERILDWTADYGYNDTFVYVSFGSGERIPLHFSSAGFSYSGTTAITCPGLPDENEDYWDSLSGTEKFSLCRTFDPLISFIPEQINLSFVWIEKYRALSDKYINEDFPQIKQCIEDLAMCQATLTTRTNLTTVQLHAVERDNGALRGALDSYKFYFSIIVFTSLLLLIGVVVAYFVGKQQGGG